MLVTKRCALLCMIVAVGVQARYRKGTIQLSAVSESDNSLLKLGNMRRTVHTEADLHSKTGLVGRSALASQIAVSMCAFMVGSMVVFAGQKTLGLVIVYFGAQSGFNILMKVIFSDVEISKELAFHGVPAAFLVTALQQAVGFVMFAVVLSVLSVTRWRYEPRVVRSRWEWASVMCLSLAFALNIGLNNFSLSLLTISVNLIIRSCLPLVTLVVQLILSQCMPAFAMPKVETRELVFLVSGVACAAVAICAKSQGAGNTTESLHMIFGIIVCSLSILAAAFNMVGAGALGTNMHFNPLDTTLYMSVPVALILLPLVFFVRHPVDWPGQTELTDWQVFSKVLELSPGTLGLLAFSGLVAFAYNVLQYSLVQSLSATHTAFAGNFNKAATIMLSLLLGLEQLPSGHWGPIMFFAIIGNIACFACYNASKASAKVDKGLSKPIK